MPVAVALPGEEIADKAPWTVADIVERKSGGGGDLLGGKVTGIEWLRGVDITS